MRKPFLLTLSFASVFLVSCSHDAYETGDSPYSYLRADFVEALTGGSRQFISAQTDGGVSLTFTKPVQASWAATADSTYRALLYYKTGATTGQPMEVEPVSARRVYVLSPKPADHSSAPATDPVHFQSSWLSANGSYANLSLALMTGVADSVDARHTIGLVADSAVGNANGTHTYYYTFTHGQGGVPQYYKSTVYVSISTKKMTTGDTLRLSLNTYDGLITREWSL